MSLTFKLTNKGDMMVGESTGRLLTLEGTPKFDQDVKLNLSLKTRLNGTGAGLSSVVGLVGDVFSIKAELSDRIQASFAAFKSVQDAIQKYDRLPEEQFSSIAQVVVLPLRDPTTGEFAQTSYAYRVDVLSVKGQKPTSVTGVLVR